MAAAGRPGRLRTDRRVSTAILLRWLSPRTGGPPCISPWAASCCRARAHCREAWRKGFGRARARRSDSILAVAIFRDIAGVAVIFVWQELARHRDLDTVPLRFGQPPARGVEIDRRHDAVSELLLDPLLTGGPVRHHQLVA